MNECDSVAHKTPEPTPAEPSCKGDYSACQGCSGEQDVLWTGMLGAMSAAYSLSPPDLAPPARVATLDAACALASLACVASLPRLLDAPAAFGAVLKALHALLVLPRYAPALPGSVDATVFYGAVAVLVGARRDRVSAVPATDCQASIFVDLVACAALSVAAVRRRRGPGVAAAFAAASLALPRDGGRLEHTDADVVVAERAGTVGGVFADAYEGARMVSSSTSRPSPTSGSARESHLALDDYVAYLERYVDRFGLARTIEFGTTVGAGETAFDVAHGAASAGARAVTMSTRRGFVSVPASFGEGRLGMLILGGSSTGWNQWVGASVHMDWTEGRKHIVNKATKCMPLLNRSAKGPAWNPYRFWDSAASHVAVGVDLLDKYEPVKFERDGVAFRSLDGGPDRVVEADVVVFATGYRQKFPSSSAPAPATTRCPAATS
ncbi:N,N-dimethylaniline monooxygenase [Aureococcus anophagefferens]|nr:N,N-dimethylaniline monooxygenase [Aureococcus anophagefferens]